MLIPWWSLLIACPLSFIIGYAAFILKLIWLDWKDRYDSNKK